MEHELRSSHDARACLPKPRQPCSRRAVRGAGSCRHWSSAVRSGTRSASAPCSRSAACAQNLMTSSAVRFGSFFTTNALTASPDLRVRHADHGAFQHAGMARDHFLDLVRIDVEAGDEDHVLLAVDDLGVAVRRSSRRCRRCGNSRPPSSPSRSRPACSSNRPSPAGPWRRFRRARRAALRCRRRRGSRARSREREGRSSR